MSFSLIGKKIWVAGHSGMVGSAIGRALSGLDVDIITVGHSELDLTQQSLTQDWIAHHQPDAVVMCAAKVGGIMANRDAQADFLYDNLAMSQNVIHGAHLAGVEKLLYLGSSCIYPKGADQPISEKAMLSGALEPTNEGYAIAKIAGMKLCAMYRRQYGRDYVAAMPCNLYGAGDRYDLQGSHVLPALLMKFHRAKMENVSIVELWGSGAPLREFLYVDDLARACLMLLEQYSGEEHVNVGGGEEISIADLAGMVARIVGYEGDVRFDKSMPDGMMRKVMDSSKARMLGWKPLTSLEKGIEMAYADYFTRYGHFNENQV